jgi:hypothetical protein
VGDPAARGQGLRPGRRPRARPLAGRVRVRAGWDGPPGRPRIFLLGEDDGIAENPKLVAALREKLAPRGFSRLMIEVSPPMAQALDEAAKGGIDGLRRLFATPGGVPAFYGMAERGRASRPRPRGASVARAGPRGRRLRRRWRPPPDRHARREGQAEGGGGHAGSAQGCVRSLVEPLRRDARPAVHLRDARAARQMAPRVAHLMASEMGRDDAWQAGQVEAFQALADHYLPSGGIPRGVTDRRPRPRRGASDRPGASG